MAFLILFIIPALIALGFLIFGNRRVILWEFLAHMGAQALVAGASIGIMYFANTHDTEVWNGRVTNKQRNVVSCRHSYPCNCRSVSCGDDCETTICDTCYLHAYDVDWDVSGSVGDSWTIDHVGWDSQGLTEPPRWTTTKIGEPTSSTHSYTNYIKGSPDTLFRRTTAYEQYKGTIPAYPIRVYDYWHLDRVVVDGVAIADIRQWNEAISHVNAELGAKKEVNIVMVIVRDRSPEWFYALERDWLGGKKNDVVAVVSSDPKGSISWVNIMAWTKNEMVKVRLRDDLQALGNIDQLPKVLPILHDAVNQFYVRRSMDEFKYLRSSITPTPLGWVISLIVGVLISVGLGIVFYVNETFTPEDDAPTGRDRSPYASRRYET